MASCTCIAISGLPYWLLLLLFAAVFVVSAQKTIRQTFQRLFMQGPYDLCLDLVLHQTSISTSTSSSVHLALQARPNLYGNFDLEAAPPTCTYTMRVFGR